MEEQAGENRNNKTIISSFRKRDEKFRQLFLKSRKFK